MKINQETREFLLKCDNSPLTPLSVLVFVILTTASLGGINEIILGGLIICVMILFLCLWAIAKKEGVRREIKRINTSSSFKNSR